jgi:hypothetical protein
MQLLNIYFKKNVFQLTGLKSQLSAEKKERTTLKRRLNVHETIYGSVPAKVDKTIFKRKGDQTEDETTDKKVIF